MKPPATDTWLLASVMAVLWAIVTNVLWALLALGFGRSRGTPRLITMLIIGAVVVAFLCAHAYREGWKSSRKNGSRSSL
jgi:fatty acid desaturase